MKLWVNIAAEMLALDTTLSRRHLFILCPIVQVGRHQSSFQFENYIGLDTTLSRTNFDWEKFLPSKIKVLSWLTRIDQLKNECTKF